MSILADLHLHSNHSGDSDATMESMILSGIEKGLHTMCFTEHIDIDYPERPDAPADTFSLNADSYLYELLGYKAKYDDKIELLYGLECGLQPHLAKENARFVKEHEYDYVIGSVHTCGGKDPYYPDYFDGIEEETALRDYLEETYKNIRAFGNFDALGHMDYIIRYCNKMDQKYDFAKYKDVIDKILNHLIDREKALEVNTGSFRKGMTELNPNRDVIKRYHELGGELITIGSDAHKPDEVANGLDVAAEVLAESGFKYYTIYSGRIAIMKKL